MKIKLPRKYTFHVFLAPSHRRTRRHDGSRYPFFVYYTFNTRGDDLSCSGWARCLFIGRLVLKLEGVHRDYVPLDIDGTGRRF